jgi:ABC-type Na+ transport system ATPase subunit NatA
VVSGVRKRFGPAVALDGMTFTVWPGQVTGFVGPNGAGKSTTMRVIAGLDAPDAGTALIGGRPYRSLRHPLSHLGALLDAAAVQPSRSGYNHLLWLARSQGLPARRVDEVTERVGLRSAIRRKAGGYSLGMRQRLGIAAALLGDPPVLGLLYSFPIIGQVLLNHVWRSRIERFSPMTAGLAIQSTKDLNTLPIGPWAGLGVLAGWTAAALITGWMLLLWRDV